MSAWRALVRSLHATGKPAAFREEFDHTYYYKAFAVAAKRAVHLGLMARAESGRWVLTVKGRDWVEGRCEVVTTGGLKGPGPSIVRSTWLASLPKPEQIKEQA